jgi:NADPH-dependent curcumin reductase CurA
MRNRQVLFVHRPEGKLAESDFEVREAEVPDLGSGEVLCRTILLSVDPANRAWMAGRTYRDQLGENEVMSGFTLSEVVDSGDTTLAQGTIVAGDGGWQQYAVLPAAVLREVNVRGPLTLHMSVLGITGLTAYFGMLEVGRPAEGETVVVSAAAGATGSVAGQLARIQGARVVGITGSDAKNKVVVDKLGFDAAVNYRSDTFRKDLRAQCHSGVDVYFDNVGGSTLETMLRLMNVHGRIACCGAVSQYDTSDPGPGPSGIPGLLVTKRLRAEGFLVSDFFADWASAEDRLAAWMESGELTALEDVMDGLESAPHALVGLLAGDNVGKRIVRVAPDP